MLLLRNRSSHVPHLYVGVRQPTPVIHYGQVPRLGDADLNRGRHGPFPVAVSALSESDTLYQQRAGDHLLLPGYFVGSSLLPVIFTRIFRIVRHWLSVFLNTCCRPLHRLQSQGQPTRRRGWCSSWRRRRRALCATRLTSRAAPSRCPYRTRHASFLLLTYLICLPMCDAWQVPVHTVPIYTWGNNGCAAVRAVLCFTVSSPVAAGTGDSASGAPSTQSQTVCILQPPRRSIQG